MGVIEDDEPPLKRVKIPLGDSKRIADHSVIEPAAHSSRDSMARPLTSLGDGDMIGPKGVIKRSELVRIITRELYSLGYNKSGALLEEESGIPVHSPAVDLLIRQVMDGKWDESVATLQKVSLLDETTVKTVSFLLLEQKFLEFLKLDYIVHALGTLRHEIAPLCINLDRAHELAACLISPSRRLSVCGDTDVVNSRSKVLEKLQKLLPPAIMVPERRLEHLVEKALDVQRDACVFHNSLDCDMSLYMDHHCGRNQIPSQTMQTLEAHNDEVWFLQFSRNGKYMASASKDQSAIIWEVEDEGHISLKHRLMGHQKPVVIVSWSPDDNQILTCGQEEVIRRWDVNSGECLHVYAKAGIGLVSCGWFPDSKTILARLTDKSICLWDLDGGEIECLKGRKVGGLDFAVTGDGKKIISTCMNTRVMLLDMESKFERLIEEDEMVTSISLSKDDKFLLVNLYNQEIHLWNIEGHPNIVSKYKGHKRARFVIRSCFGGFDQAFIASGSEDSQVYIWHRYSGELLLTLPGHSGAVNCVSWNPVNLHMLASASDDRTIRIWGLNHLKNNHMYRENGTVYSNGKC